MSWTHPDAQENINSIGASHITNGRICVLILDCSYLTGKRIWSEKGREKGGTSFLCAFSDNTFRSVDTYSYAAARHFSRVFLFIACYLTEKLP